MHINSLLIFLQDEGGCVTRKEQSKAPEQTYPWPPQTVNYIMIVGLTLHT